MIMPTDQAHPVNGDHLPRIVKKKRHSPPAPAPGPASMISPQTQPDREQGLTAGQKPTEDNSKKRCAPKDRVRLIAENGHQTHPEK